MDRVDAESARMADLVDDLLLLARLDAGRPLERETVDLSRLVLEAVDDARVVAPDHQLAARHCPRSRSWCAGTATVSTRW